MLSRYQKEGSRATVAAASPLSASPRDGLSRPPWSTSRASDAVRTPARGVSTPLADDEIWKRLREVGLDEETLRQKDKAALIAYITKLETDLYDYQYQMGLLLLEKKELATTQEKVITDADSAEVKHKLDQAMHLRSLAESEKREMNLKRALGVEKECVVNLEKALREMRSEYAEIKTAAEAKLAEARTLEENAQNLSLTAESRLHAAEALEAEGRRHRSAAERKLQEVEAREDELRRRQMSFNSESEAKEEELRIERQRLQGLQTVLQEGQKRLLDGQSLLTQREKLISEKFEDLRRLEEQLEARKETITKELLVVEEEKANLSSMLAALAIREEAAIQKELLNQKKEQELLIFQANIASKERDEIKRLMNEHQLTLELRKKQFEADHDLKRKMMEDELATQRRSFQQREANLNHREELLHGKEHELEMDKQEVQRREREMDETLSALDERKEALKSVERKIEMDRKSLQEEREDLNHIKLNLDALRELLENEKKQVLYEQGVLEMKRSEREGFLALETKLKEEIDNFRAQMLELEVEADELKSQKLKLESEWELIDEKRGELQREIEHVAEERKAITRLLKEEQERLKFEKDALHDQFKYDSDLLFNERKAFISKMNLDHSEWFTKIQRERADIAQDFEIQKSELENSIKKRHEEIERFLKESQEFFEQEKARDISHIKFQRELACKELEEVAMERKKLETKRLEIALDREQIKREWSGIKNDIVELQIQQEKLKKQRELLQKDREDILNQIQILQTLEGLHEVAENTLVPGSGSPVLGFNKWKNDATDEKNATDVGEIKEKADANGRLFPKQDSGSVSPNRTLSWLRRCAERIFKITPERSVQASHETDPNTRLLAKHSKLSVLPETESPNSDILDMNSPINDKMVSESQMGAFMGQSFDSEKQNIHEVGQKSFVTFSRTRLLKSTREESKVIHEVPSATELGGGSYQLSSETSLKEIDVAHCKKVAAVDVEEKRVELNDGVPNKSRVSGKRSHQVSSNHGSKSKRAGGKNKKARLLNDITRGARENTNVDSFMEMPSRGDEAGSNVLNETSIVWDTDSSGLMQAIPLVQEGEKQLRMSEVENVIHLQKFECVANNDRIPCGQSPKDALVLSSSCDWKEVAKSHVVLEKSCLCPAEPSVEPIKPTIHHDEEQDLVESMNGDRIEVSKTSVESMKGDRIEATT